MSATDLSHIGSGASTAIRLFLTAALAIALPACSQENEAAEAGRLSDSEATAILHRNACNACHEVDEFRIGPSYRAVALRYQDNAEERVGWLAAKIVNGGAGSWGAVPMVGNPDVSADEARQIARWILGLEVPES